MATPSPSVQSPSAQTGPVVVFDLDGTLIDSMPDIHAAVNVLLAEENLGALDLATVQSFVGNGLPHLVKCLLDHLSLSQDQHADWTARLLTLYETKGSALTAIYPGVIPALEALRSGGARLGICTNKPISAARVVLDELGLSPYFDGVLGGDSLPQRKPDPAPLLAVFEALGPGPRVYVGDSEVDAATAKAAKVPFLLYTEGYLKSPAEAVHHSALFDHFDRLGGLVAAQTTAGETA